MSFAHLAGITTPGAPDEIIDWFSTFEAWITGTVGWTIASGAGTTDLVITSAGEVGGLTMLFVHVWRDPGNPNRVKLEVQDDAVGTHATTRLGYVDSGGVQFAFWMSADKDAINIVWKIGAGYRHVYGGLLWPFALNPTDETYYSIATTSMLFASILRRHDGVWDQDDMLYSHQLLTHPLIDRKDGSFPLGGVYFGDHADIAGQLKHVSCRIQTVAVNPEDTIETGQPGSTTTWIILADNTPNKFALRTGGVLPTGVADGAHFAHTSGTAPLIGDFLAALLAHMVAIGWTATDYSGTSGRAWDYFFYSTGEDGTEDIYIRFSYWGGPPLIYVQVSDGIPGAHATTEHEWSIGSTDFPTQYYISADLDCVCLTINEGGVYGAVWAGLVTVFSPGLPDSTYKVGHLCYKTYGTNNPRILRTRVDTWNGAVYQYWRGEGTHIYNSQPNLYDGTTYLVWPHVMYGTAAAPYEIFGQLKYYFQTHGGGVANLDTITVGAQVYTVFIYDAGHLDHCWAMRTA